MIGRIHLPLFLFALTLAFIVKVAVHQAQQLAETAVTAQVSYKKADQGMIILDPVQEVRLRIRGPSNEIAVLSPYSVEVEVSLEKGEQGVVNITEDRLDVNVRMPGDFEVISIEPNSFSLTVEAEDRQDLPVRVELTGEPVAGAYAETPEVKVDPPWVKVVGPRSVMESLTEVVVLVSLDGHGISFEETAPVVSPDPLVKIEPRQVQVTVPMTVPGSESPVFDEIRENEEPIE